jgi:hypothetical protein
MMAACSMTFPPPRFGRARRATTAAMSSSAIGCMSALTVQP